MKNYYTIAVVVLGVFALVLGGLIIFQRIQVLQKEKVSQAAWQKNSEFVLSELEIDIDDVEDIVQKEFTISVGENTQLFGIAAENPYYGEPPASPGIAVGVTEDTSFEIWGDVVFVDFNDNVIRISTDDPRPINTDFTPRGPKVLLEDIKVGDRIVASGIYDENGEADYSDIEFIQISPSIEEIERVQETYGKYWEN